MSLPDAIECTEIDEGPWPEAVVTSWAVPSLRKGSLVKFMHTARGLASLTLWEKAVVTWLRWVSVPPC
jgi:hypothetical protein